MKRLVIIFALLISGCATQHQTDLLTGAVIGAVVVGAISEPSHRHESHRHRHCEYVSKYYGHDRYGVPIYRRVEVCH
jgi:hypothetical protein